MKTFTLLKQRMINHEKEPEEFLEAKKRVLQMRDVLVKVGDALKSYMQGAQELSTSTSKMNTLLAHADKDLEDIALAVLDGLSRNQTGFAVDSITRKTAWLKELDKKASTLDELHLEYSRAQRKHQEASAKNDATKTQKCLLDLNAAKEAYDNLYLELFYSFQFVLKEATGPNGEATALGLLSLELAAFKSSQLKFFKDTGDVLGRMSFAKTKSPDLSNIWNDFYERKTKAVSESMAAATGTSTRSMKTMDDASSIPKSGKQLLRAGFSDVPQNTNNVPVAAVVSAGRAPPPPPPPVSAVLKSKPKYRALYAWVPQNPDELPLRAGEVVTMKTQMDDGWVEVVNAMGRAGMVPFNYLESNDDIKL